MSNMTKQLIMSTVKIVSYSKKFISSGTGFVFLHEKNGKKRYFVVTNKHVIKDADHGEMVFHEGVRVNGKMMPKESSGIIMPFSKNDFWGNHNENIDIAVMNITPIYNLNLESLYIMAITNNIRPSEIDKNNLISPIEDILFIGYPDGRWDSKNLLPIARKGITATPYYIDYEGEKKFLVDASVFPGSSGSPVFIYHAGTHLDNTGNMQIGEQLFFIGIIAQYIEKTKKGDLLEEILPSSIHKYVNIGQALNLGIVFNDTAVVDTMDDIVERILDPIEEALQKNGKT